MKVLAWLTEIFLNTFGITRPRPEQERTAQIVIGGFLLAVLLVIASLVGFFVLHEHAGAAR
ncbi:MAG TPA: hypothetical protein VMD25_01110 [Acidobacteriaceae bacterium]|nr:hypothetical protein [Acidobacteriaceae bacterium]